jgi:hypothetical protein
MSTLTWSTKLINFLENDLNGDQQYFSESPYYDKNRGIRKSGINFEYTEEEKASLKDISSAVKSNLKTYVMGQLSQIKLHDYQEKILESLNRNRFNLILNSRQSGITTVVAIHALTYIISNTDRSILIVSPKAVNGCDFIEKLKHLYISLPFYLKPGVIAWNKHSIKFENGCSIRVVSSKNDIGYKFHNLIMQDAALIPSAHFEYFYRTIIPTVASHKDGKITIYSTPNGVNKFYELYAGDNYYHKHHVKWNDVPGRDEEWKKKEILKLGSEEAFAQEYEGKFIHRYEKSAVTLITPTLEELKKQVDELEKVVKDLQKKIS